VPLAARQVKQALTGKLECEIDETHHHYYVYRHNGEIVTKTRMSHGREKEIGNFLIGKMADQLKVSKSFFTELVTCTKSHEDYCDELRSVNLIE